MIAVNSIADSVIQATDQARMATASRVLIDIIYFVRASFMTVGP